MLKAQLWDGQGNLLGDEMQGDNLGFSLSSVTDALKSAYRGVKSAVNTAAGAACNVLPMATTVASHAAGSQYQSSITKASTTAQKLCSKYGPKPAAATPAAAAAPMMTALPAPTAVAAKVFPAGSIQWLEAGRWHIAIPVGTSLGDYAGIAECIFGDCGLADATHTVVATQDQPAEGVQQVDPKTGKEATQGKPFYKKPLFWVAIGGGVVVLGTGGYFLFRRKA